MFPPQETDELEERRRRVDRQHSEVAQSAAKSPRYFSCSTEAATADVIKMFIIIVVIGSKLFTIVIRHCIISWTLPLPNGQSVVVRGSSYLECLVGPGECPFIGLPHHIDAELHVVSRCEVVNVL